MDESKAELRAVDWDEDLLVAVLAPSIPKGTLYWNGDRSRPYVEVACIDLGRAEPSQRLLRRLGAGRVPTVARSSCSEGTGSGEWFETRTGRHARFVGVDRIKCIDDNRCLVWTDGYFAGGKSWWKRGWNGWREISDTRAPTWIT